MHSKVRVCKEKLEYISICCIVLITRVLEHITKFNLLILLNDSSLKNVGLVCQVIRPEEDKPTFPSAAGDWMPHSLESSSPALLWCYFSLIRLAEQHK